MAVVKTGSEESVAVITPYRDGPYLVRGEFALRDPDGEPIPNSRRTVALCRCGKSRTRPFCDGTHKLIEFRAPGVLETWPPERPEDDGLAD
jgi:CDGSH-type Zn-finger protein